MGTVVYEYHSFISQVSARLGLFSSQVLEPKVGRRPLTNFKDRSRKILLAAVSSFLAANTVLSMNFQTTSIISSPTLDTILDV